MNTQEVENQAPGGTLDDGANVAVGTGTRIGTAVSQKLGLCGTTPVVQPSGVDQAAVTLGNLDGEIGGLTISDPPTQAEVQALRDACEELADDVRALSRRWWARCLEGWWLDEDCSTQSPSA